MAAELIFTILLVIAAIIVAYILYKLLKTAKKIAINIIAGFLVLIIYNYLIVPFTSLTYTVPLNLISLIVTALTGVFGALVLIILSVFGITF
ncbi:MAG: pro-sigmaK processing inhibitor BofA family protein [Methanimicrococcus sp.]|nr:pro-sigmaK processing inhibitor BofA family protein [Methanimicrococcus sp.]